ncbi:MAG TPA: tetratricopeptide repeat protein [Rhodospirillales bacterium]|nr:tetratricopeptide repeat protein [Rhodospirillales bacterium]
MITEAIVMGAIEAAVYRDGDKVLAARLSSDGEELIDCTRDLSLLVGSMAEKRHLPQPPRDREDLRGHLLKWSRRHRALNMLIAGMDSELTNETRLSCIQETEFLLNQKGTANFARARILGCPPSDDADIKTAIRLSLEAKAEKTLALYYDLDKATKIVSKCHDILREVLFSKLDAEHDFQAALRNIIDIGIVAEAITAIVDRNSDKLTTIVIDHANDADLAKDIPRAAHVLTDFIARLKSEFGLTATPGEKFEAARTEALHEKRSQLITFIIDWKDELAKSRSHKSRTDSYEALDKVNRQKTYITGLLKRRQLEQADKGVLDLANSQYQTGCFSHLCKSLSDLGSISTRMGLFDFAKRLFEAAQLANDRDPVPFNGYAETLRQLGKPEEALAEYEKARKMFPDNPVPFNGYAETLRQQGKPEEALAEYGKARKMFPNDPVPFTGYAETLRQLGKPEEALAEYEKARERFPNNRVVRNAAACIQVDLKRFEEARDLIAIDAPRTIHDWWDYHVFAMSFLREGNREKAIKLLSDGLRDIPFFISRQMFETSLAMAELQRGNYLEAAKILDPVPDNVILFPDNVILFPVRAVLHAHARAALNQKDLAENDLALAEQSHGSEINPLCDALRHRYTLGSYASIEPDEATKARLDADIYDGEFELVLRMTA